MTDALLAGVVRSLWFGAAGAGGLLLLGRCGPRFSPTLRHASWFGLLLLIAILPFSGLRPQVEARRVSVQVAAPATAATPVGAPLAYRSRTTIAPESDDGATPAHTTGPTRVSLPPLLTDLLPLIWLGGGLVGLVLLLGQLAQLRILKHRAVSVAPRVRRIADQDCPLATRRLSLLRSDDVSLPSACGYFRPAIMLPGALIDRLPDDQVRHLVLHEAAHLQRYDDWLLLAERLLLLLCWWHPVAWIARRQLDAARELACDALVTRRADRKAYALTLVTVAELALPSGEAIAPGALRGVLSHRVEALLRRSPDRSLGVHLMAWLGTVALATAAMAIDPPRLLTRQPAAESIGTHQHTGFARGAHAVALDSVFSGYATDGFSGTVLLAQGDSLLLSKGYGLADREGMIPATRLTRYSSAGMTKMFTAAAILVLQDEGELMVGDTLGRWFPDLPEDMARVTLHQLLTHTDGLTRLSAPVYREDAAEFIEAVAASPRAFGAGRGYRYNDFGHSILGVVIERVTGERYEEYIRRRFLIPAGMRHSSFEPDAEAMAVEYRGEADNLQPISPRAYTWGRRGSLGLVTTAEDLFRWSRALHDATVVPPTVWQAMQQVYGTADWGAEVSYGWDRMPARNGQAGLWRRVAGTPGMEGELLYDATTDRTAVILVNTRLGWRFKVWSSTDFADFN